MSSLRCSSRVSMSSLRCSSGVFSKVTNLEKDFNDYENNNMYEACEKNRIYLNHIIKKIYNLYHHEKHNISIELGMYLLEMTRSINTMLHVIRFKCNEKCNNMNLCVLIDEDIEHVKDVLEDLMFMYGDNDD